MSSRKSDAAALVDLQTQRGQFTFIDCTEKTEYDTAKAIDLNNKQNIQLQNQQMLK